MKVNPNLFSSKPKTCMSLIFFGTIGIYCETKVEKTSTNTKLIISQLKKLLEASANFCNKNSFTEESLCNERSMKI